MLIEVQALTDEAQGMNPRRVAVGLEANRLALLLAVLHRHGGVSTAGRDVFRECRRRRAHLRNRRRPAGGARNGLERARPAAARASSSASVSWDSRAKCGRCRTAKNDLREAAKHGFERAIVPEANKPRRAIEGLEVDRRRAARAMRWSQRRLSDRPASSPVPEGLVAEAGCAIAAFSARPA